MTTQAAPSSNATFLRYAPTRPIVVPGTIATGVSTATLVSWNQAPPETPVWIESVDFEVSWTIAVSCPASDTFTVSPFAPWSAFNQHFTVAGALPWSDLEMTAFYFDWLRRNKETTPYSAATNAANFYPSTTDRGPYGSNFEGAAIAPGTVVTNSGSTTATYTLTWTFTLHLQLQQVWDQMWGMLPLGDPKNRINQYLTLNTLVGTAPEANLIVSATAGVTAATATNPLQVYAIYNVRDIDILPKGVGTPTPLVQRGLSINASSTSITAAGQIYMLQHTDAMIYTAIDHVLVNNQTPIRFDYFSLLTSEETKDLRWAFDSQDNSLGEYFAQFYRRHGFYPPKGWFQFDGARGEFPPLPSVTPYDGLMTPNEDYANEIGVQVTPLFQTATRIATGTSLTNAYVKDYEWGLLDVPY